MLKEDWEFSILNIFNYNKYCQVGYYFDYIIENHARISGDLCEAGVFQGKSLLATALLLKELGSKKVVYGFDTFTGFPPVYHEKDNIERFFELEKQGRISAEHLGKVGLNKAYRELILQAEVKTENISQSGNFSNSRYELLVKKIEFLKLDNIKLVKGPFSETMVDNSAEGPFMAALMDCDLYQSYCVALPYIWKRLSRGGYIFLDEYYSFKFPGARIAVDEFCQDKKDKPQMHKLVTGDFERWFLKKLES